MSRAFEEPWRVTRRVLTTGAWVTEYIFFKAFQALITPEYLERHGIDVFTLFEKVTARLVSTHRIEKHHNEFRLTAQDEAKPEQKPKLTQKPTQAIKRGYLARLTRHIMSSDWKSKAEIRNAFKDLVPPEWAGRKHANRSIDGFKNARFTMLITRLEGNGELERRVIDQQGRAPRWEARLTEKGLAKKLASPLDM